MIKRLAWGALLLLTLAVAARAQTGDSQFDRNFKAVADQWKEHCRKNAVSSNVRDYLDTPSYRKLVQMGKPALPLIMEAYRKQDDEDGRYWAFLLADILRGEEGVPFISSSSFKAWEMKAQWLKWWDENKGKTNTEAR